MLSANILRTFFTRGGTAMISLLVVMICSRLLGDAGMGEISLLLLAVSVSALVSGLWAGAGIVYLTPRYPQRHLLLAGYSWSVAAPLLTVLPMYLLGLYPQKFGMHVYALSVLAGLGNVHMYQLLGKENIRMHNIISLLQSLLMLGSILCFFYVEEFRSSFAYVYSLYISYGFVFLVSFFPVMKSGVPVSDREATFSKTLRAAFDYSLMVQSGSVMQLLNYRLSYFLVDHFLGTAALGRFSVAVQVAEGLWIFSRSIGLVLFSRISNLAEKTAAAEVTLRLFKISVLVTTAGLLMIFCVPSSLFTFLFGEDFADVKRIIMLLSPGIVFVAGTTLFSAYFSGTGRIRINTYGSLAGFAVTVALGWMLTVYFGMTGAVITTVISYFVSLVYAWAIFIRDTRVTLGMFIPRSRDFRELLRRFDRNK